MNPYDHLESEQSRMEKMRHFMIDNKKYLCEHGGLHPIIERKGKYIPGNVYNCMENIHKIWNIRVCWD